MKHLTRRFSALFFVATLLLSVVAGLLPNLSPQVAASGETFKWSGSTQINVSGGQIAPKADSKGHSNPNYFSVQSGALPGQGTILHGILYFYPNITTTTNGITEYGCKAAATLTLTSASSGVFSLGVIPPPKGPVLAAPQPNCTKSQINGLNDNNKTVALTGFKSNTESKAQREVEIQVSSPKYLTQSQPTLTGTITDSTGNSTGGQQTVNITDNGGSGPKSQHTGYYDFIYYLDPGKYTFCTDSILKSCWTFTKIKYQSILKQLGELPADRTISVEVDIPFFVPVNQTNTYGPAEVQLFDPKGNLLSDQTAPPNTVKARDPNNSTTYMSGYATLYTTFQNVNPGNYKICLPAIGVCNTIKKLNGQSAKVVFKLSNSQGTALAAQPRPPDCYLSNDPLSFAICPIFNAAARASNWVFANLLEPFLVTQPIGLSSKDPDFQVWSNFRIYGDIILVLAVLVLIIGQAITGGLTETYNLKKLLPRVLLAAILLNLSIYIVALLVDITNVIGLSISDVMTAPIKNAGQWSFSPNAVQGLGVLAVGLIGFFMVGGSVIGVLTALFFSGTTGSAAFVRASLYAAMFVIIPLLLAIIAVFVTLIVRKGLILFLIMAAPVAFALYCMPNTEKYFKKWWELLTEALLVFPIIVVIFAVADIMSVTTLTANHITSTQLTPHGTAQTISLGLGQIIAVLFALFMQVLPLFAIPWSFRLAGATLSRAHAAIIAGNQKVNELAQKQGEARKQDFLAQKRQGQQKAYRSINRFGSRHRWARHIPIVGTNALGRVAGGYNIEGAMAAQNAQYDKEIRDQIKTGVDTEIRALTVDKDTATEKNGRMKVENGQRMYKTAGGRWVNEADVDHAYARWGGNHSAQTSALAYEMTKATKQEEVDGLVKAFPDLSKAWGMNEEQANDTWIGAGFANQHSNMEFRYTSLNNGKMELDGQSLMTDVDEKRGNYAMALQHAEAWTSMQQEYKKAQATMGNTAATATEKQQAQDILQRGSRIARSMTMQMPDGSHIINTSNAPGRAAEEMEHFVQLAHPGAKVETPSTYGPGQEGQPEHSIYTRNR